MSDETTRILLSIVVIMVSLLGTLRAAYYANEKGDENAGTQRVSPHDGQDGGGAPGEDSAKRTGVDVP